MRSSLLAGTASGSTSMLPCEVPTQRLGPGPASPFLLMVSQKWKAVMTSRASRSRLVTLELRERLNELSFASAITRTGRGAGFNRLPLCVFVR